MTGTVSGSASTFNKDIFAHVNMSIWHDLHGGKNFSASGCLLGQQQDQNPKIICKESIAYEVNGLLVLSVDELNRFLTA